MAINFEDTTSFRNQGFSRVAQIIVEVSRMDELSEVCDKLRKQYGDDCVIEYFQVPDCAQVTHHAG